ncbi:MAG: VWA domain-containing protein, partial [Thermoguttaceae bacterium]
MTRLSFSPLFGSSLAVLLIFTLLVTVVLLFAPKGDRVSSRGRKWLLILRIATLALLALLMLRPTIVYTETFKLPASLFLLLDNSESMSVRDEVGGKSRFESAKQTLKNSEKSLQQFQKRFEVHPFLFNSTLRPLEMSRGVATLPDQPDGTETAIGFALDEVYQRAAGKRVIATILMTDGMQRTRPPRDITPRDAAVRFRDANFPLYTVSFGKPGVPDNLDVAVKELLAPSHVFVKNEMIVSGQIRVNGYINQRIPVRLMFETESGKMEEVATKEITATEDGQLVPYRFSYIPMSTGLKKISVEVPVMPKEVLKTNNEMSTFVRVMDGGLNVLFLEGAPYTEQLFVRRSIDSSADIQLKYVRL